jgi:hypothetical protein
MAVQSDESHSMEKDQTRFSRGTWVIILFALVAVAAIVMLKSQNTPVVSGVPDLASSIDYPALVKQKTDEASRQNQQARKHFESSVNREIARYEPWFEFAAKKSSLQVATPTAMGAIVYCLAKDKVSGTQETDRYLETVLGPILKPIADAYARDVGMVMNRLDYDLRGISVKLATDLAAIGPGDPKGPQRPVPNVGNWRDFDQALKNLGFNIPAVGVSTVFDAYGIASSKIGPVILKRIAAISSRMFAKHVLRLAATPVLTTMSGPIPIGPLLALANVVLTAYDLQQMQSQFANDVSTATRSELHAIRDVMNKHARKYADDKLAAYKKLQASMGNKTMPASER